MPSTVSAGYVAPPAVQILIQEGAAGGTSLADVLLARRSYQELLLDRSDLDADAFDATLKLRQAAALFPRPTDVSKTGVP